MSDDFFPFSDHDRHGKYRSGHDSHYDRSHHHHDDHDHYDSDRRRESRHHDHDDFDLDRLMPVIEKITRNKMLLAILCVGAFAILAVCVTLVIVFYPVLVRIVDYVFGGGLKGILDFVQSILGLLGAGE